MKKWTTAILAALLAAGIVTGCTAGGGVQSSSGTETANGAQDDSEANPGSAPDLGGELNVFTWDGYFPQDVIEHFTLSTGIKINFSNFESNEEMLTKLQASNAGDYDVVVVSDYMVDIMRKLGGLLNELDKSRIPNFSNIDPSYQGKFYDPDNLYTVPYGPGTPLIVYDPEVCKVDIQGYEDLWNPELKDSIVMMDSPRVVIGITLKTMGKSFNETDPAVLDEAKTKLMDLKPNIRNLSVNNLQDAVISGESSVGFMFTSQVAMAMDANPNLKLVYPKEGLGFGIDALTVPANAPNKDNAYQFLNYILDPEVGANISSQIMYLCPNKASADYLPEAYKNNPAFATPPEDLMASAEFVEDVGTDTATLYEKIWTEFKQS